MGHSRRDTDALADRLEAYDRLVEIGIGRRTDVACALADRGVSVTATDVHTRSVPDGVNFVADDVVDPDIGVYEGCDAIYALNLPPELHRPALEVARRVDAEFLFTTLGGDQPAVPVRRETIGRETVFVATSQRTEP
ncbi:UPF0146 family protein [Halobacteria archaeon AArc-m2/3/4]|uniref:UPF0146 protein OB955_16845 n=1 Tax=Natronoglomus mannanivorans TaxID=2979990 RepID=A0AAP2Z296_9EURY|nr:UPF0146 family protein [Halobacteria archaeon AArc-xg1-1]MCU4974393.1 UPF0146 family protein [Halobacteria archaeon AArc-m2/3/4]